MSARPAPNPRAALRSIPGFGGAIPVGLVGAIRRHGWLFVSGLVGLSLFFGVIYARVFLDKSAFEIADLTNRIAVEQQVNQDLRLKVAELEAPGRVFDAAVELGLGHPGAPPIVVSSR